MIKLEHIKLQRGPQVLLNNANLTLHPSQKIGLIGANGAGKSSLFALLTGQLSQDGGELYIPKDWRIAYMRQEIEEHNKLAVDYVLAGDTHLIDIQQKLIAAEATQDDHALAQLHAAWDNANGYSADARARKLLAGLGFANEEMTQPVNYFSGGWQMRLNLAQALMCPSELLLLDEPTNHLDLDAIIWLEAWLKNYQGTLILISHDRDFLDAVVDHIVHLEQQQLLLYKGGYSAFENVRAERLAQQQQAYEKQQAQRAHMESFISRFKAKATKARQAQSRIKALEKLENLAPAHIDSPFHFNFREANKTSSPLLGLREANLGYTHKVVLSAVKLQIMPGARIGLLGPNGTGKSTLIKTLAGQLPLISGYISQGENLAIGYFAQHQLDALDNNASPLLHLQRIAPQEREQELRNFLGGFDFKGDRCDEPIINFSGGEKARLALALIAWQKPNILLLDEPTNHLDLEMRHALTMALQDFSGAMILVSHDRHLLTSTTDEFILVANGQIASFDGDLADYSRWLIDYRASQQLKTANTVVSAEQKVDKKAQRQQAANLRQQLAPYKKQTEQLEHQLSKVQEQLTIIEQQLADPSLYEATQKDKLLQLLTQQTNLKAQQTTTEEKWLMALEQLEYLEQQLSQLN